MKATTILGNAIGAAVLNGCSCGSTGMHVYPCPFYTGPAPMPTFQPLAQTHYHFTPQLSDGDVERIAKRVVELLKETP